MLDQKIKYDDEALFLIAESSDGSLRDGLQILDRMINFCDNDININKVSKNLNIIGSELYLSICDKIINNNISEVLVAFDKALLYSFTLCTALLSTIVCTFTSSTARLSLVNRSCNSFNLDAPFTPISISAL